jgi:hypothetical protein
VHAEENIQTKTDKRSMEKSYNGELHNFSSYPWLHYKIKEGQLGRACSMHKEVDKCIKLKNSNLITLIIKGRCNNILTTVVYEVSCEGSSQLGVFPLLLLVLALLVARNHLLLHRVLEMK